MTNERKDPRDSIDFGADADVVPNADPAFDAWIRDMAPDLNAPGAAPRAEMWKAIKAARSASDEAQAGRIPGVTPLRRHPWRLMSVIAAALLLGVAIDRFALRDRAMPSDTARTAVTPPAGPDSADPTRLYRMVAAQTLTQAEALLTAYRASGTSGGRNALDARQLARWGRDVLGSTRLLLDSPAADDPQLRALLGDLELVLVQIIQYSGAPLDPADRALIDRVLEDRNLIPRIRTVVPAGVAGDAASDD